MGKKKRVMAVLMALLMLLQTANVYADVIPGPNDDFALEHADKCRYEGRTYFADVLEGETPLYKSPENSMVVASVKKEEELPVTYIYKDGNSVAWALIEGEKTGWTRMDYLTAKYDSQSFYEEHKDEIQSVDSVDTSVKAEYQGKVSNVKVHFWNYPGSTESFEEEVDDSFEDCISMLYRDKEKRLWGCVGYYYGHRNEWVCLTSVVSSYIELYGNEASTEIKKEEKKEIDPSEKPLSVDRRETVLVIVGAMVGAVVLLTIVILLLIKRKKKVRKIGKERP